jgi:hypothetical protein
MATTFRRRSTRPLGPRPVRPLTRPERPAPTAALIDAVLRFHDVTYDQGGGRSLLRLSEDRLHEPEVEAALGKDASRAARVSILWNERESEIIRVLEAA